MTDEELAEIERVWAAATPGPWIASHGDDWLAGISGPDGYLLLSVGVGCGGEASCSVEAVDIAAITAAPSHIAALLAEVKRLRAIVASAEEMVEPGDWDDTWDSVDVHSLRAVLRGEHRRQT